MFFISFKKPAGIRNEPGELSRSKYYEFRDGFSFLVSNDFPRFSYDGGETNCLLVVTNGNNITIVVEFCLICKLVNK